MFMELFGFGKRRHTRRKLLKKGRKLSPPKKLLKLAKRLGVKVTVKRGSRRVYKSIRLIKKAVAKKRRMIKKKRVSKRKGSRFGRKPNATTKPPNNCPPGGGAGCWKNIGGIHNVVKCPPYYCNGQQVQFGKIMRRF
jgi:hypothetical protein